MSFFNDHLPYNDRGRKARRDAGALAAIYAAYPAGPERDAALAGLEPSPNPEPARRGSRDHWDRATVSRRQG